MPEPNGASCDPALTRKEFLTKIVKGIALTGGVVAAPKVLDQFIIPAYAAGLSSCSVADTGGFGQDLPTGSNTDAVSTSTSDQISLSGTDSICPGG